MAVVDPDGIRILDNRHMRDTVNDGYGETVWRPIEWEFETNTQGANRAHDAWCRLQQIVPTFGNLSGKIIYGIRSYDVNGKAVVISKTYRDTRDVELSTRPMPYDIEDALLIRRDLKEWRLFAESIPGEISYGQLNNVQYRYTPISVNPGYEFGSVETFEYGRSVEEPDHVTTRGIPKPYIDDRKP
jgi:hypothetical protein